MANITGNELVAESLKAHGDSTDSSSSWADR